MKRAILFLATILLTTILIGCCDCRKRAKLEKPLVGTEWQLVQIMGREVVTTGDCYTSIILAWKIPWTEEPGRLQSIGSQRVKHD